MSWDANNLHRYTMFQKLPADGFKWRKDMTSFSKI